MNILIVRLGAMGDIIHAVPAAAALRAAIPGARIDWLVDAKHQEVLQLVTVLDRVVPLAGRTMSAWVDAVRQLRRVRYDVALDFQGLMKSAILARASGATRVAGFSIWHLREKSARPFYSETGDGASLPSTAPDQSNEFDGGRSATHVIRKNLNLLRVLGVNTDRIDFPIARVRSPAADELRTRVNAPFAILNPAAAWPNKQWPTERFGAVATFLREVRKLPSVVLWGPGERRLGEAVVEASNGAAQLAPATTIHDLFEISRLASLVVSGDTGPLHIAAAVGTPVVAIFGPTDPDRNGPWAEDDEVVARYDECGCHYDRRCHQRAWCLDGVPVAEVTAAVQQRLARSAAAGSVDTIRTQGPGIG